MNKFFLFVAAVVTAMTVNADPVKVILSDVANYIDFQALSVSDPAMVEHTVTSTDPYELANGSVLLGFQKSDGSEASNTWNVKGKYNTTMPTPELEGVDSLTCGTMFRAASGTSIILGAFETTADGKISVYFQPNGDSDRGVSIAVLGGDPVEFAKSGKKIGNIRPAYAAEVELPAGVYDAGDVVIKLIKNTSNIFGVRIDNLKGGQGVENVFEAEKAVKFVRDGQVVIKKGDRFFNLLGAEIAL